MDELANEPANELSSNAMSKKLNKESDKLIVNSQYQSLEGFVFTDNLLDDARHIIDEAKRAAYKITDTILIQRNWLLGKRIAIEDLDGKDRAEYGARVIKNLAKKLTEEYGSGFDSNNLYRYLKFYRYFPDLLAFEKVDAVRQQSSDEKVDAVRQLSAEDKLDAVSPIFHAVNGRLVSPLSWTHFRILLQVPDKEARNWYAREAIRETWGTRTLQRNVSSQYYHRLLKSHDKKGVHDEMVKLTAPLQDKLEYIKNPVIAEFLGLGENHNYHESVLENAILDNLQRFIMELGKGYAWMARQQRIHTEKEDYYIDLVFYNVILKCYVLIDLKTSKVTHQDVGQMDMYIRMYDELKRTEGDNPTIGIILCADTDDDIARFSVLHDNDHLFASKYMTYMPSKAELREEIERQKLFFHLSQKEKGQDK